MEHKDEKSTGKESIATASQGESRNAGQVLEKSESKGVLESVWSAAGALAESVQHAVQGTLDAAKHTAERFQHDAETVGLVGGYVAQKVAEKANTVYENVTDSALSTQEQSSQSRIDTFFSSPTSDMMAATTSEQKSVKTEKIGEIYEQAKQTVSGTLAAASAKASEVYEAAKTSLNEAVANAVPAVEGAKQTASENIQQATEIIQKGIENVKLGTENVKEEVIAQTDKATEAAKQTTAEAAATAAGETPLQAAPQQTSEAKFELTMDMVAHLQRIADRTGDAVLHETARKAHSACAKGLSDAPGVHLVKITPDQATELVNLAIMTQDHELADFARYCQSVAATSQIGIEPSPGKIQEELSKGRQSLQSQGRVHTGPGYGAAFASIGRNAPTQAGGQAQTQAQTQAPAPSQPAQQGANAGTPGALALTMDMVAHIQRIADRTGDAVLHETARRAHSAAAKNLSEIPGVHLVRVTPEQATELVNLAIRTQDHELANFARYCQSVAATNGVGIEPSPGKIAQEIAKGRQELAQGGRAHTGPGYGAAFASISRSSSQQNLTRSGSQQNLSRSGSQNLSRSGSQQNMWRSGSQQSLSKSGSQQNLGAQIQPLVRAGSQQNLSQSQGQLSRSSSQSNVAPQRPEKLELTMDVVAHLQRIADRTGDPVLHDTARRAHSACAKNLSECPGVHLTFITPDQATELVNLAIRTQDHELANFARYCQSVAATTGVAVEPSPGKIQQEIEKGRLELQQQGRAHTGPGYGAAFASLRTPSQTNLAQSQQPASNQPSSTQPASNQPATTQPTPTLQPGISQEIKTETKTETKIEAAPEPSPIVGLPLQ